MIPLGLDYGSTNRIFLTRGLTRGLARGFTSAPDSIKAGIAVGLCQAAIMRAVHTIEKAG